MLALTKKTDYALIALTHLARRTLGVESARAIASTCRVPLPILTNIMKSLAQADIVYSERGAAGGYGLAKSPEAITLYELICATEGPLQLVQCVRPMDGTAKGNCELERGCPIRPTAHKIHRYFKEFLEGVTLAELVQGDDEEVSTRVTDASPPRGMVPVRELTG